MSSKLSHYLKKNLDMMCGDNLFNFQYLIEESVSIQEGSSLISSHSLSKKDDPEIC